MDRVFGKFSIFHSDNVKNSAFIIVLKYSGAFKKYKYNFLKMPKTCLKKISWGGGIYFFQKGSNKIIFL